MVARQCAILAALLTLFGNNGLWNKNFTAFQKSRKMTTHRTDATFVSHRSGMYRAYGATYDQAFNEARTQSRHLFSTVGCNTVINLNSFLPPHQLKPEARRHYDLHKAYMACHTLAPHLHRKAFRVAWTCEFDCRAIWLFGKV